MSLECPPHARRERKSETWVSKMLLVRLKSRAVKKSILKERSVPASRINGDLSSVFTWRGGSCSVKISSELSFLSAGYKCLCLSDAGPSSQSLPR